MSHEIAKQKIKKINEILVQSKAHSNGLLGGSVGLLYYFYNASKILNDNGLLNSAETLLHNVFEDINKGGGHLQGPLFSNGAAGFAYTVNYLQKNNFIDFDIDETFSELDEYLFDAALLLFEKDKTDYLHGAMGIFHYFSSRVQTPTVNEYLNKLSKIFCNKAIVNNEGLWFVNLGLERLTKNSVDFGLAHGLTGYILLLLEAWHNVDNKLEVEKTIRLAIEYILKHELPTAFDENEYSFFPFTFESDATELSRINRLAWCYGDLSVVLVLYRAGNIFGDRRYTENADRIGQQVVKRKSVEATFSLDTHFCHGSSGLAQFYKAIYKDTFNHIYYTAYEYWIAETISLVDKEILEKKYGNNPISLLEGWTGVAMVLTDYVSFENMDWGKLLLL
jgi:lantibiotic biosynthesis protein